MPVLQTGCHAKAAAVGYVRATSQWRSFANELLRALRANCIFSVAKRDGRALPDDEKQERRKGKPGLNDTNILVKTQLKSPIPSG
jgi:hypothetical protein